MSQAERDKLGNLSREWALENYDCVKNSAKIAKIFDDTPFHTWDFTVTPDVKNPNYPNKEIADNREWLKDLYKGALDMNVKDDDSGLLYWVNSLSKGVSRQDIYRYFINEAAKENQKHTQPTAFDSILDKTGNKRILVLLKESMGDVLLASSLLENIKLAYLSYDLYFATDLINFDILVNNKYIHKVIPWMPEMNEIFAIYNGFDVFIDLSVAAQKTLNYLSNKPSLDLINKQ